MFRKIRAIFGSGDNSNEIANLNLDIDSGLYWDNEREFRELNPIINNNILRFHKNIDKAHLLALHFAKINNEEKRSNSPVLERLVDTLIVQ